MVIMDMCGNWLEEVSKHQVGNYVCYIYMLHRLWGLKYWVDTVHAQLHPCPNVFNCC